MKHISPADPAQGRQGQILAGPETGIDSCIISQKRLSRGVAGGNLHSRRVDQFYYVVSGSLKAQLGTDVLDAGRDTLIFVPAGTPYGHWNEGAEDTVLVELLVPQPAPDDTPQPAEAIPVPNASQFLRRALSGGDDTITPAAGFGLQNLADRSSGSTNVSIAAVTLQPALGGARLHFHDFDQFYFVLEGTLDLQIGTRKMAAGPNSLVVLPAGTLHANFNAGPGIEKHVTMRIPEPLPGESLERLVEIMPDQYFAS